MWGSGEVLHLGGGGEHVPRARPTGEPVAVRVPGSAEEGQALGAELGGSDTDVTVPLVDGLAERKVRPDELFADTAYGSGRNAFEASCRGTELVSPVAGSAPGNSHEGEGDGPPPLTGADFQIDVTGPSRSTSWRMRRSG